MRGRRLTNLSPWPRGTIMVVTASDRAEYPVGHVWELGRSSVGEENAIGEYPDDWAVQGARPATPEEEAAWRLGSGKR